MSVRCQKRRAVQRARSARWLFAALVFACGLLPWLRAAEEAKPVEAAKRFRKAAVIRFNGEITPWLEGYLDRKLAAAQGAGADLVVVQIDSPGGYLEESGNMAEQLRALDWARTVAYIPSEALSGGAYVALGCDEIVMHPTARIGDVGIIFLDSDFMFHYAPEKFQSNLVQEVRILAAAKGRPPALAEAMVDMNCEVFRVRNTQTDKITFMSEKEIATSAEKDQLEKLELVLESEKGRFLTLSGTRAAEVQLANATVNSFDELKARYPVERWIEYRVNTVDKTIYVLNLWWVTGLLLLVGMVGLFKEMAAPGTFVGMLTAGLCFALFFWSRYLSGTSGVLEIMLFAAGVIFLAVELFVLPGFGVAGIIGILLLLGSLVLACQNFIVPETERQLMSLGSSVLLVSGSTLAFLLVASVMVNYIGSVPILNRLMLAPPTPVVDEAADETKSKSGAPALVLQVGERGTAETPLRPAGRARFASGFVEVASAGDFIPRGAAVEIVEIAGHRIVVQAVSDA